MAFRDSWHSALVYFGLAENRDPGYEEEDDYEPECYRGPRRCTWENRRCFENRYGDYVCRGGDYVCRRPLICD